jgi:hypothetical protein
MAYRKTSGKLLKAGKELVDKLLNSNKVKKWHKTLLLGIKDRGEKKNLSPSDGRLFDLIRKLYKNVEKE